MKLLTMSTATLIAAGTLAIVTPFTAADGFRGSSWADSSRDNVQGTRSYGSAQGNGSNYSHGSDHGHNHEYGNGGYNAGYSSGAPTFVNITCGATNSTGAAMNLTCDLPRNNEQGVYVCRTRYNTWTGVPTSSAVCIATDRAVASDVCGCCGKACPIPCTTCPCEYGVEVLVPGMSEPLCVPSPASAMMVAKSNGTVTCNTNCV